MSAEAVERQATLGSALEAAVRWALPASPLFLAILMLIAHAPYASPIVEPSLFYLACMAGAILGLACYIPARRWDRASSVSACWIGGVALEVSWFVLLYAEKTGSAPVLVAGSLLAGCATVLLLVLWLWVGQTDSLTCEVAKLACAFATAFALYSLFSVVPHGGVVSYLFPVATCVPLTMMLRTQVPTHVATRNETAAAGSATVQSQARELVGVTRRVRSWLACDDATPLWGERPSVRRSVVTGLLVASFGAGFSALGFGGARVEQGAGLLALALIACLVLTPGRIDLLRIIAMPLVAFSLCYDALAGHGNAFAFFIAGCGSLAIWLYLQHRFGWPDIRTTNPREIALRLMFIVLTAGAGMALGQISLDAVGATGNDRLFTLVGVIVLTDAVWRLEPVIHPSEATERGMSGAAGIVEARETSARAPWLPVQGGAAKASGDSDATTERASGGPTLTPQETDLEQRLGLSPREAQVAALLCESRSASYISKRLGMATSTTKTHVRHVYEKAGVHSRDELQRLVDGAASGEE